MTGDGSTFEDWLCAGPGMVRSAVQECGRVSEQVQLAEGTYRLRVECPGLAGQIRPGQFFMIRPCGTSDPLLGRPFALYDIVHDDCGEAVAIDFVYHVIGKVTGRLSEVATGEVMELWGPLGNGFPPPQADHLVCVGGGIGYTPFLAVAREASGVRTYGSPPRRPLRQSQQITLCYGVRNRTQRADLSDFNGIPGIELRIATEDGSEGHPGLVTDLVAEVLANAHGDVQVYCCGPEPMMHAVARLCAACNTPCWLSLETPMACGFGACFSCVTKVRTAEEPGWDYRRTCVEGPVFEATALCID